jgi:hypothetical protein
MLEVAVLAELINEGLGFKRRSTGQTNTALTARFFLSNPPSR